MTQSKFNPKDFFLWLTTMAALYMSVVSFLILVFQYVNVLFPDDLVRYYDPYSGSIRFSIASLFVVFPLYLVLVRMLHQDVRKHHEKNELGIRKWLIYLTLFVTAITMIVDLIVLLNTFLGGEITTRFAVKVLATFIVAGSVFGYYLLDLRGKWEKNQKMSVRIGIIASVIVFATVISGFFIIGSPQKARNIRLDQERINDLQSIQWQVINYWQAKEVLPATLADLEDPLIGFFVPKDPQSNTSYEYTVISELTFELCATFNLASDDAPAYLTMPVAEGRGNENWNHAAARSCFERTIDPAFYKPMSDIPKIPAVGLPR